MVKGRNQPTFCSVLYIKLILSYTEREQIKQGIKETYPTPQTPPNFLNDAIVMW